MSDATPALDAHREHLLRAFARDVEELEPTSLLDVGHGRGRLLDLLVRPARRLVGAEPRRPLAPGPGWQAVRADARALPFADGGFDWVVVRHVLHHLADAGPAVGEAWRCARHGLVLAEPASHVSAAGPSPMARFDRLTTQLMNRAGHIHHPYLDADALLARVPGNPAASRVVRYAEGPPVPPDEVRTMARLAAAGLPLGAHEQRELASFDAAAHRDELRFNGSVAVIVWR